MIRNKEQIQDIFHKIDMVEASYLEKKQPIYKWRKELHETINKNKRLYAKKSHENDVAILKKLYSELLMRGISGEKGNDIKIALEKYIKNKNDLNHTNFVTALKACGYRFVNNGAIMMMEVLKYFSQETHWNWRQYFEEAKNNYRTNFKNDDILKIKTIGYKVRDLALSTFDENYIANDIHIIRVASRLGLPVDLNAKLLNLLDSDRSISKSDYLKLHKVFVETRDLLDHKYSLADIDRMFWHFGRTICSKNPKCNICPVSNYCNYWLESHVGSKSAARKKIVYVDMDGVLVDFMREMREAGKTTQEEIDEYTDNTEGLFRKLKPIPGAIEAFEWLSEHFEVFILTTAPWKNISALSDKRWWVGEYLPGIADKKLIITHRKDLNKGDYIIDDRTAKGVKNFEGEHIYFGKGKFSNWDAVIRAMQVKEGINEQ